MNISSVIQILLALYGLWYLWSHQYARTTKRVLQHLYWVTGLFLRYLGGCFGVTYTVILHESHARHDKQGYPHYNDTARTSQSLFTWHPHSALTVMPFTLWQPSEVFGRDVFIGVARPLYFIPILREILMVGNCRIADDHVLDDILESGSSLMIQPGGVYEQVRFRDDREIAYFNSNLGFLRKAVKHGIPVVPSYSFGENQLFKYRPERVRVSAFLSRLGLPTSPASGLFGLPAGLNPFPGKPKLVVGGAISINCLAQEGDEDTAVCRVFEAYLASLRSIWQSHHGHLPTAVGEKGLRFVYRLGGGQGDVFSDKAADDQKLVAAFASRCRARKEAADAGKIESTLSTSKGKAAKQA